MRHPTISVALMALLATTAACHRSAQRVAAPAATTQIAWREGDVEDAFAEAKQAGKPVLLYWGAR